MRLQKTHFITFKSSVDEATELNYLYLPKNLLDTIYYHGNSFHGT